MVPSPCCSHVRHPWRPWATESEVSGHRQGRVRHGPHTGPHGTQGAAISHVLLFLAGIHTSTSRILNPSPFIETTDGGRGRRCGIQRKWTMTAAAVGRFRVGTLFFCFICSKCNEKSPCLREPLLIYMNVCRVCLNFVRLAEKVFEMYTGSVQCRLRHPCSRTGPLSVDRCLSKFAG